MKRNKTAIIISIICGMMVAISATSFAAVSAQEAGQLKTTLTPLGAEKAGNKEGTIPAWDGGLTTPAAGFVNGGKRPDLFPNEKPLYSIVANNMDQYADKLTEGMKVMLKKYPGAYRLDVYPTRRTHAAPQWVYDNTFSNATRGEMNGDAPVKVYGGIPFPIPKIGVEVMWNCLMRWRAASWHLDFTGWMGTAEGKHVMLLDTKNDSQSDYYLKDGSLDTYNGLYYLVRSVNAGPPIRAGEAITGRVSQVLDKTMTWVYITGQRRVRKLPLSCCDTPTPFSAGMSSFDEVDLFQTTDTLPRFNWKIIGKKEMFIPYNSNKLLEPDNPEAVFADHFIKPDLMRWELHRVWIIESELKEGQRHTSPKTTYYIDEDSWTAVLADRWDARGQLWRTLITVMIAAPDIPAAVNTAWGYYDLLGGTFFVNMVMAGKAEQYKVMPPYDVRTFTPDAMAGEGVR
ncbi:MAG: DUF1329 domain-containing protein [Pseudomonadota bacterium]